MKFCCCCYLPHISILAAAWICINKQTNKQTKHKTELLINRPEIFKSGPTWICSMHISSVIPESWIPKTDSINGKSQFNAWPVVNYSSSWAIPLGMELCRPHTLKYHMERKREREREREIWLPQIQDSDSGSRTHDSDSRNKNNKIGTCPVLCQSALE